MAQKIIKRGIGDNEVGAAKVRLENDSYLRARDAANAADVNLLKLNATDGIELPNNVLLLATPTLANHVAKRGTISGFFTEVNEQPTGTIDGVNDDFVIGFNPAIGSLKVFLNGVYLTPTTDWTLATLTITLASAPILGQVVRVSYLKEN